MKITFIGCLLTCRNGWPRCSKDRAGIHMLSLFGVCKCGADEKGGGEGGRGGHVPDERGVDLGQSFLLTREQRG